MQNLSSEYSEQISNLKKFDMNAKQKVYNNLTLKANQIYAQMQKNEKDFNAGQQKLKKLLDDTLYNVNNIDEYMSKKGKKEKAKVPQQTKADNANTAKQNA